MAFISLILGIFCLVFGICRFDGSLPNCFVISTGILNIVVYIKEEIIDKINCNNKNW